MVSKRFLFLTFLCLFAFGNAQAAEYEFTDLGSGTAVDINNSGVIALNDGTNAFRVQANERRQITNNITVFYSGTTIPPYTNSVTELTAWAINDLGHVVGVQFRSEGFLNLGDEALALSSRGSIDYLGLYGVNNTDAVVGSYIVDSRTLIHSWISNPNLPPGWQDTLNYSQLRAINNVGVAVGFGADTDHTPVGFGDSNPYRFSAFRARAFKLVNGTFVYLDTRFPGALPSYHNEDPAVRLSEALAINLSGAVVGNMAVVADGPKHAFRHVGNGMEDLGTLGGDTSQANDINDAGLIVGESTLAGGATHAFLYDNGSLVDLNTLLPAGVNAVFTRALAINNQGQIVGEALFGGAVHGVLMSPDALPVPPKLTLQPEGATVALGGSVTLSAAATGGLPLAYQWEKDAVPLAGQTASILALTNLKGFDSGSYRAVVTNGGGTAISEAVTVTVLDPQLTADTFVGLALVGEVGASYRIEFRPKADASPWQPLETVKLTNSPQWWVDMASVTNPMRLYQAVRLP